MKKTAFHNPARADMRHIFNWGLKISDFSEIFYVTGHGTSKPEGDPVGQTAAILKDLDFQLKQAGFTRQNIVRTEWTFDKRVSDEDFSKISKLWADFLIDVEPKPAAGTLRYVERLANRSMLVEYEMVVAR